MEITTAGTGVCTFVVHVLDETRVSFTTVGTVAGGLIHREKCYVVSVRLEVAEDGRVLVETRNGKVDPLGPTGDHGMDVRSPRKTWRAFSCQARPVIRRAAKALPALVKLARSLKSERAAAGVKAALALSATFENEATNYDAQAKLKREQAALERARADRLQADIAWAVEPIASATEGA